MTKIRSSAQKLRQMKYVGVAIDFVAVVLVYLVSQFSVLLVIKSSGVTSTDELYRKPGVLTGAYIFGGLISIGCTYAVMKYRNVSFGDILLRRPKLKDLGYGILGFGAYFFVVRVVLIAVSILIPAINLNQSQNIGLRNIDPGMLPLAFIALAILPPLSEELLFRGFFLHSLRRRKVAAVASALLVSITFGAMHGQWNVSIDTFVLSMIMIYTITLRRSLWVSIAMHMIKNTLAFLALFVFKVM